MDAAVNEAHPHPSVARGRVMLRATSPCVESLLDLEQARVWLRGEGWDVVEREVEADLVIVWTCGVDRTQEERALREVRGLRARARPDQRVVVTGCLAAIQRRVLEGERAGLVVAPSERVRLETLLAAETSLDEAVAERLDPGFSRSFPLAGSRIYRWILHGSDRLDGLLGTEVRDGWVRRVAWQPTRDMVFLRIASGCLGRCGYCAVRQARGNLRSVPPRRVLERFEDHLRQGQRRITLVATDAGAYGLDLGSDLAELLAQMLAWRGAFELAIDYLSPDHLLRMADRLLPLLIDPRVRFLCVPVQSGSPAVLRAMRRDYDPEALLAVLLRLAESAPQLVIKGIFMVGHPGEDRDAFRQTMGFVARAPFHNLVALTYSPRPGTPSAALRDDVPLRVKRVRRWRLFAHWQGTRCLRRSPQRREAGPSGT